MDTATKGNIRAQDIPVRVWKAVGGARSAQGRGFLPTGRSCIRSFLSSALKILTATLNSDSTEAGLIFNISCGDKI